MEVKIREIYHSLYRQNDYALPTPCCIVEYRILEILGYHPGEKMKRIKIIQDVLSSIGLKTVRFRHYIQYIPIYFQTPQKIIDSIENKCKYTEAYFECYEKISDLEGNLNSIKYKLNNLLNTFKDAIDKADSLDQLYYFHKYLDNAYTNFYRKREKMNYCLELDKRTQTIYDYRDDRNLPIDRYIIKKENSLNLIIKKLEETHKNIEIEFSRKKNNILDYRKEYKIVHLKNLLADYKNGLFLEYEENGADLFITGREKTTQFLQYFLIISYSSNDNSNYNR